MNNSGDHKELFRHMKNEQEGHQKNAEKAKKSGPNALIVVTCLLELLVLAFVISVEMVLR